MFWNTVFWKFKIQKNLTLCIKLILCFEMSTLQKVNCQAPNILFQIWLVSSQTSACESLHLFFFQIIESWKPLEVLGFHASLAQGISAFLLKSRISTRWQNNLLFSCVHNETSQKVRAFCSLDKQAPPRPDVPPLSPSVGLVLSFPFLPMPTSQLVLGLSVPRWDGERWLLSESAGEQRCRFFCSAMALDVFPSLWMRLGFPSAKVFYGNTLFFVFLCAQHTLHSMEQNCLESCK